MKIVENVFHDELLEIFEGNNHNFVHDKDSIFDENKLKVVCVEDGHAIGYLVLYLKNDFIQQKNFSIDYTVESNAAYFWQCITKEGFEGKGVQSKIFEYTLKKFGNYIFYSVVDIKNSPSLNLHKKFNFKEVAQFPRSCDGEIHTYLLMRHE